MGFIYLIKVRTSSDDNLYKLGKTKNYPLQRIRNYNSDTELILTLKTTDCSFFEKRILTIFRNEFISSDIGNEYFFGDETSMINLLFDNYKIISKENIEIIITDTPILTDPLELKIQKHIIDNYIINNNIKYKIQFITLYNSICTHFDSDTHYVIKNTLPFLLKKIGLTKKRFNKGMFWFGLQPKNIQQRTII